MSFKPLRVVLLLAAFAISPSLAWSDDIRQVNAAVDDLVYNSVDGKLYGGSTSAKGIVPIDTATASAKTPVSLGLAPTQMVISSNGRYIDSVLAGGNQIRRFNTATQTAGIQWGLGHDYSDLYAKDIVALPGSPGSVVVSRSNSGISPALEKVVIYDNGVLRDMPPAGGVNFIEVNETGTRLYGYLAELSSFDFVRWDINSSGLNNGSSIHNLVGNADFKYAAGRAYGKSYSNTGIIFDPETGASLGEFTSGGLDLTVPDATTGRLFTALQSGSSLTIQAQNLTTLAPLGSIVIPNVNGSAGHLLRWGTNGLAFRSDNQVFLIRSGLVNGALPTLTKLTPNSAQWGAPVVITGTNLLFTSAVRFNGLDAQFKVDSDTQITATVPANATTAPVSVVTSIGSANTLPFTVQSYVPPSVSIGDASITEGTGGTLILSFPITLSAPAGLPVTVTISTADGTAVAPQDYTATSAAVQIPVGQTTAIANVPIVGDAIREPAETFFLYLSDPINATLGDEQAVGLILNDDSPTLSVAGSSVTEGNTGNANIVYTFSLSYATDEPVTFDFTTANGTALAGSDYVARSGSVTISPGQPSATVNVQVIGDTLYEGSETVYMKVSHLVGAVPPNALTQNSSNGHYYELVSSNLNWDQAKAAAQAKSYLGVTGHLATITSAQEQSFVTDQFFGRTAWLGGIQAAGSAEPSGGFGWVTGEPFSYTNWDTAEPNNVNGNEDAINLNNSTRWNDASRSTTAPYYLAEYDVDSGAPGSGGQGVGVILNDDPEPPTLSVNDVSISEGNSGSKSLLFTVTLSKTSASAVTVQYATTDGTAIKTKDYTAISGTLSFSAGQTSKTLSVPILGDTLDENDETFSLGLNTPTGAFIAKGQGNGTIIDDDAMPSLSINDVQVSEGNTGSAAATFTVKLSAVSGRLVKVNFATINGTAKSPADFIATKGTLAFAPGEISKAVVVNVAGDTLDEADEQFQVKLNSSLNAVIANSIGTGTILDDDVAVADSSAPTVSISSPTSGQTMALSAFGANTIAGSATDDVGVVSVAIKLYRTRNGVNEVWNGTAFTSTVTTVPAELSGSGTSLTWKLGQKAPTATQLDAGSYQVIVYARDASGKSGTARTTFTLTAAAIAAPGSFAGGSGGHS